MSPRTRRARPSARSSTTRRQSQAYAPDTCSDVDQHLRHADDRAVRLAQEHYIEENTSTSSRRSRRRRSPSNTSCRRPRRAQTFQTRQVDTKIWKTDEQWTTSKSQSVETTTQYVMQVDQYQLGRRQVFKHQYQTHRQDRRRRDRRRPAATACRARASAARPREVFANAARRPGHLLTGPPDRRPGPGFLKTTCIDGPSSLPYGPVATCAPGFTPATSAQRLGRDHLRPTRRRADAASTARASPARRPRTPTSSSTPARAPPATIRSPRSPRAASYPAPTGAELDHDDVHQPPGPTNFAATPSLPCTVGSTYRRLPRDDDLHEAGRHRRLRPAASPTGTSPPYIKVTCLPPRSVDTAVPERHVHARNGRPHHHGLSASGRRRRTRRPRPWRPALDGATTGFPDYFETDLHESAGAQPDRLHHARPAAARRHHAGRRSDWITRDCRRPAGANNATAFADPRFCINDPGTAFPYLRSTARWPRRCRRRGSAGGLPARHDLRRPARLHRRRICARRGVSAADRRWRCTPTDPTVPPYIVTTCGNGVDDTPVAFVRPRPTPFGRHRHGDLRQARGANNAGPTQVADLRRRPARRARLRPGDLCPAGDDPSGCGHARRPAWRRRREPAATSPATQIITCYNSAGRRLSGRTPVRALRERDRRQPDHDGLHVPDPANNHAAVRPRLARWAAVSTSTRSRPPARCPTSTDFVPTAACPASTAQSGTGPEVICTTTPTLGALDATCAGGVGRARRSTRPRPASGRDVGDGRLRAAPAWRAPTATPGESRALQPAADRRPGRRRRLRRRHQRRPA